MVFGLQMSNSLVVVLLCNAARLAAVFINSLFWFGDNSQVATVCAESTPEWVGR